MAMQVDNSSAIMGLSTEPIGDTYRGFGSSWFNAEAVAREDWQREEQSAQNAFLRDMYQMEKANEFSASEAQKDRDWQERMSSTAYQRAMEDMKIAGLNPVLAFQNGGASTPSGTSASSSSVSRSSAHRSKSSSDPMTALISGLVKAIGSATSAYIGSME